MTAPLFKLGAAGDPVLVIQTLLNAMPSGLARLVADGKFGPRTQSRVMEFQKGRKLQADGVVGPLTFKQLNPEMPFPPLLPPMPGELPGLPPGFEPVTGRFLNEHPLQKVKDSLFVEDFPALPVIDAATFSRTDHSRLLNFSVAPGRKGRVGFFAVNHRMEERAYILVLPERTTATRLMFCIPQSFGQAHLTLEPLGWGNPLAPGVIDFLYKKHVLNRWGAQTLAATSDMAFLYPVRSKGNDADGSGELGPLVFDPFYVAQMLIQLMLLTRGAFATTFIETMTFSSGIADFNKFLRTSHLIFSAAYNIDPRQASQAQPKTPIPKLIQFASGQTSLAQPPGFVWMPEPRWEREPKFKDRVRLFVKAGKYSRFDYMHNHCMPNYILHLGLRL